jgi:hypothetical protein
MQPPSYRERLRTEGVALLACGLIGSAVLMAFVDEARDRPERTIVQLVVVTILCAVVGPLLVKRWTERAEETAPDAVSGDPTPLWQLPLIVAALALLAGLGAGMWDAALRVTGGCALIGLTQAVLMAGLIERRERRESRRYLRLPGSSLLRGTRLGYVPGR